MLQSLKRHICLHACVLNVKCASFLQLYLHAMISQRIEGYASRQHCRGM